MVNEILTSRPRAGFIVVAVALGFVAGQVAAVGVIVAVAHALHFHGSLATLTGQTPPWWANIAGIASIWCGMLAAVIVSQKVGHLDFPKGFWRLKGTDWSFIVLGVGAQLGIGLLYLPFHLHNLNAPVHRIFGSTSGAPFFVLALCTVVGAPLVEELFFRATLYRALESAMVTRWGRRGRYGAMVLGGLLFGLAHGEWTQLAGLALFGVVLAYVLQREQRYWASVITHASFNGLAVLALLGRQH